MRRMGGKQSRPLLAWLSGFLTPQRGGEQEPGKVSMTRNPLLGDLELCVFGIVEALGGQDM